MFWLYYVGYSSFHHVNPIDLLSFPVSFHEMDLQLKSKLTLAGEKLMNEMKNKSVFQTRIHKGGNNSQAQTFYPSLTKDLVDEIDLILSQHYNFNLNEVDKIINYDIVFRLQKDEIEN